MLLYLFLGVCCGAVAVYFWHRAMTAATDARVTNLTAQVAAAAADADRRLTDAGQHHESVLAQERTHAAAMLAQLREQYDHRIRELELDKENLKNAFGAAARDSLQEARKEFSGDVETHKREIAASVQDMKTRLGEVQQLVTTFEKERSQIYGSLATQLQQLAGVEQALQQETSALRVALTTSTATVGNWGEMVLRNIFTLCQLREGIDYREQVHTPTDGNARLRPDFVVTLPPGGHGQVIDAKAASLEPLLRAETVQSADERKTLEAEFARTVRSRIDELASKEYQKFVDPEVPYVVMFIPNESAVRVAFGADGELFTYAMSNKVIISSPATIMPLLLLIARAWRQHEVAANAEKLAREVEVLGERLGVFVDHLAKMESAIESVVKSWNRAAGSWQTRLLPQIERARALGATLPESDALDTLKETAEPPRHMIPPPDPETA